jgi:hypothetical protein
MMMVLGPGDPGTPPTGPAHPIVLYVPGDNPQPNAVPTSNGTAANGDGSESESKPDDRYLLMKLLDGTRSGCFLTANRLSISGWTDASFTASTDDHSNLPLGFNHRANDFLLLQNWLRIERTVVTKDATEPSWGFRSDTILPGSDYRFTLARGVFDHQLVADHGQPELYGIDPIQFYIEAYFPNIAKGMDVKLGRIFCQYGIEVNDAPSNALLSHAYTFIYDPFTHTGLMTTTQLDDAWSIQAGIMLGSDDFIDPVDTPTGMGGVKWAPKDGKDSVLFSVIVGSGRFNQGRHFHNPEIFDLVYTHKFNDKLNYSFESLYGFTTNVPAIGTADWLGVLNYLTYDFCSKLSGTVRLEFFDDAQGQRTDFRGLYTDITAGLSIKPRKDLVFRPEVRYDYNTESRPFENTHGLFTAAMDVIVRW